MKTFFGASSASVLKRKRMMGAECDQLAAFVGTLNAIKALTKAVGELPDGHFELNCLYADPLSKKGFGFLGHAFKLDASGELHTSPSESAIQNLLDRGLKWPDNFGSGSNIKVIQKLAAEWVYTEAWKIAFSECDDAVEYAKMARQELMSVSKAFGIDKQSSVQKAKSMRANVDFRNFS